MLDFDAHTEIDRVLSRYVFTLVGDDRQKFVNAMRDTADFYEKAMDRALFDCAGCGGSTVDEYYMVTDAVWEQATQDALDMLCIGCLEERIGRKLTPGDFPHYPVNSDNIQPRSDRLLDRLGLQEMV